MRLIDADALRKRAIREFGCIPLIDGGARHCKTLDEFMIEEPTIEADPVVHAHWEHIGDADEWTGCYQCSRCLHGDEHSESIVVPRCWFCGAHMDEEATNGE